MGKRASHAESLDSLIGLEFLTNRIVKKLGGGGMIVYEAEDISLHRTVAVKFLPDNLAKSAPRKALHTGRMDHKHAGFSSITMRAQSQGPQSLGSKGDCFRFFQWRGLLCGGKQYPRTDPALSLTIQDESRASIAC
jgi:hypothetical protein